MVAINTWLLNQYLNQNKYLSDTKLHCGSSLRGTSFVVLVSSLKIITQKSNKGTSVIDQVKLCSLNTLHFTALHSN